MISALRKWFNRSVATLVAIAVVGTLIVGVVIWRTVSDNRAAERADQMSQYALQSSGMELSFCFGTRRNLSGDDVTYVLDDVYDGNLRRCALKAFGEEFRNEPGWSEVIDGRPGLEGFFTPGEVDSVLAAFEGREERSLDAASEVIDRYSQAYASARERFRKEVDRRVAANFAEELATERKLAAEAKAAKPVVDEALKVAGRDSQKLRVAAVLVSCQYDEGTGGYRVALDAYERNVPRAVVEGHSVTWRNTHGFETYDPDGFYEEAQDYGVSFNNARKALCD